MRYDQLVCAACAGRVVEGRCPVCRAVRSSWRTPDWQRLLMPILAALTALACLLTYYARFS